MSHIPQVEHQTLIITGMEGCLSQHVRPILNKDTIDSVDDWRIFMRALSDNKVILLHEQRVVPEDILRYPMEAKEAERIIRDK